MAAEPVVGAGSGAPRFLLVGTVRKPHGIRGELFVGAETDRPDVVFRAGRVLTLGDAHGRPTGETLTIERARPFKGGVLLKLEGHSGRDEVIEALRGRPLLIPETEAAALQEDEVFFHDLVGLRVVADGEPVGTVREVLELPASEMLVVRRPDGREAMVPFVRELVRRVDVAAGVLEIAPPEGLLEL